MLVSRVVAILFLIFATLSFVSIVTWSLVPYMREYAWLWDRIFPSGSLSKDSQALLQNIIRQEGAKRLMEIGFNRGSSARAMLESSPDTTVISFDLGAHPYVKRAKTQIDKLFPSRHTLILGDSRVTVKQHLLQKNTYDLILIDGGHFGTVPWEDLSHAIQLLRPNGIVVMDDCQRAESPQVVARWREVPSSAVNRALQLYKDSVKLERYVEHSNTRFCVLRRI